MAPYKDEPPAVCVYTVCDESRYLIVKNVPALGCGDDLFKLFSSYGDVEECKPMDAEYCEPFTDVFWIKFRLVSNASRKIQRAFWFYPRCFNRRFTGHNSIRDQPRSKFLTNELHSPTLKFNQMRSSRELVNKPPITQVSSDMDYFESQTMNQTVRLVREKFNKIQVVSIY